MHPTLLKFGNFVLPTYGVMAAMGLIVGLTIIVHLCKRDGLDEERCWNIGVMAILGGVFGAKLLLVINEFTFYRAHPADIFSVAMLQAGGVFYGGLIGAFVAPGIYIWRHRMPFIRLLDHFAVGTSIGHAIGRLGCFAAGCCYGKPTEVPWSVVFTDPLANKIAGTPLNVNLHPTQLYEFAAEMVIFPLLLWMWKRRSFEGQVMGAYMFLYGVARFFFEYFRGDPERGSVFGGMMTGTQLIAVGMVVVGGILWMWRKPFTHQPQQTEMAGNA